MIANLSAGEEKNEVITDLYRECQRINNEVIDFLQESKAMCPQNIVDQVGYDWSIWR